MRTRKLTLTLCCAALLAATAARAAVTPPGSAEVPRVFLIDPRGLAETRRRIRSGDKSFDAPLRKLEEGARKALGAGPFSVTSKAVAPPFGR